MKRFDIRQILFAIVGTVAIVASGMTAEPSSRGKLCIDKKRQCIDWPSERVRVPSDVSGRPFVFIPADGRKVTFGVAPKDPAVFDPDKNVGGSASLRIHSLQGKHAATPITIRLDRANPPTSWVHTMRPRDASAVRELRLDPGNYELLLIAEKHLPLKLNLKVPADAPARLGVLSLREAPVMIGRVIEKASRQPVPNAVVLDLAGQMLATSDAGGAFEITLIDESLREIVVEAPEHAPKSMELRNALTASSLGDILVSRGGTAVVKLEFPESLREAIRVTVMDTSDPNEHVLIAERVVQPHESSARFEDLEPGRYAAIVEGQNALERFAIDLSIEPGRTDERTATIRPNPIVVKTLLGDEPLPDGTVHVTHTSAGWKTEVHTNDEGEYEGVLWQPGALLGAVSAARLPQPHVEFADIGAGDTVWELVVPDRRIVGRVVDRETSRPIEGASLNLSTWTAGARVNVGATSREDGSFEFTAVKPGPQVLTVTAPGYVRPDPADFAVAENDRRVERIFELTKGVGYTLHIRNSQGGEVQGAAVYAVAGATVVGTAVSDSSGTASLPAPPGVSVAGYVFPQEGSFSILRLPAVNEGEDSREFTITVPPALASLAVTVADGSGHPIEGVRYLVRYEGEFLPPSVLSMQRPWQASSASGEAILQQLPTGFYELWPYRTTDEALALMGAGGISPLRLGLQVSPGVNRAAFELRPR